MKNCNCKENLCDNVSIRFDKNCNLVITDNTFNCNYVQVYILQLNTTTNIEHINTFVRTNRNQNIIFNTTKDGFYTLCKLTIPVDETKPYYYKDGYYYHNIQKVELEEILSNKQSQVQIEYFYYFSTCNLKKCFIKLCQDIFKEQSSICNRSDNTEKSYKRNLIWAAMSTINYLAEMDQMEEAQRLLEEIVSCNGLCSSEYSNDCGCNG